jgi:hypothetical protein
MREEDHPELNGSAQHPPRPGDDAGGLQDVADDNLDGLSLGDVPDAIGKMLLACPTMTQLDRILRNQNGVSAGELQHITLCPRCVTRVRAFRREHERVADRDFRRRLRQVRGSIDRPSAHIDDADKKARLCFTLIGQDEDLDQWLHDAWRCSHAMAHSLRAARVDGAGVEEQSIIIDLRLTALGSAASSPVALCSSMFDAAWPLAELVKEGATEVVLAGAALFRPFARAVAAAARLAGARMRAMLANAMLDLLDRGEQQAELATMVLRRLAAAAPAPADRLVLAALAYQRADLPADFRASLCAGAVYEPRVYGLFRASVRDRHRVERVLADGKVSAEEGVAAIERIVERAADAMLSATAVDEALLRLIALRRSLGEIARFEPNNDISIDDVFRSIAIMLVRKASVRSGSSFLLMKCIETIATVRPRAFIALADLFSSLPRVVRQGLIAITAESYERSFRGAMQESVPHFVRSGRGWNFNAVRTQHPLEAFCRGVGLTAASDPYIKRHLIWMNERMQISARYATATSCV